MNASILRSASLAVAIAALSIGARESTAQSPYYNSVRPVSYPIAPVTNYGTTYLNGSHYSTPVYGSTVYGNTVYGNTGYAASPYINPSIAPGGCFGPTNGSVYRPNHPYGTAASDPYWNTRPNGWNNNSWNNQWPNSSWDNRWDARWNNSWSSDRNDDRWRHDHSSSSTWDRSRDDRSRHNGTSGLFSPVRP